MGSRVRALLKLGKAMEALQDAKRLYYVSAMGDMEQVQMLVAECISAANPAQPETVEIFKREQLLGYEKPGTLCTVLVSITLDAAPYDHAADSSKAASDNLKSAQGNMLLLAGKPKEAQEAFERAGKNIKSDTGRWQNTADIARAIKAQDGTVGRANEYLRKRVADEIHTMDAGH